MKNRLTTIITALALYPLSLYAQLESNIVITDAAENYTLVPDKSGSKIVEIKNTRTYNFMATRAPATALDYVFYDTFTRINKATVKAKGVKPEYQSAISAGIFYDDSKVCSVRVPLEEINKPVKTHFELTLTRPDIEPCIFLAEKYPVRNGTLTITMPIAFKDRYDVATANFGDNITLQRGPSPDNRDWVITVNYHDLPALNIPIDAPSSRRILPTIQFIGHFANPQELYNSLHSFTSEVDPDPELVHDKALEITAGCETDIDRVRAIYNWVNANIRYVAIEHGDLGHRPEHASKVLANLYGDCKGSANLIKAMLGAVGLDGRLVWIGTNSIPDDFTDRPVYASGNHMIAALKLPGDSLIYLDGTVGFSDFGVYTSSIQGKQTIVEDGSSCIIGRIPTLPASANTDSTRITLNLTEDNTLTGTFHESLSGGYKASLLNSLRETEPQNRNDYLVNYITRRRPSWSVALPVITNDAPDNGPAVISSGIVINRAVKKAGNKSYLTLDMAPWMSSLLFEVKDRHYPGWLSSRRHITTSVDISLPSTLTPGALPKAVEIENDWVKGSVTYSYDSEGHRLNATLSLTVNKHLVPLADIETYNDGIRQLSNASNIAFTLNNAQP